MPCCDASEGIPTASVSDDHATNYHYPHFSHQAFHHISPLLGMDESIVHCVDEVCQLSHTMYLFDPSSDAAATDIKWFDNHIEYMMAHSLNC
jgi:hypothetical protein